MKEILESLELNEETKTTLSESFDNAVLVEATKLAESKEKDYEVYIQEQILEMQKDLEGTLDSYLDKVVQDFVQENTFAIDESIKTEKYDAVLEGFNSLIIATGVEIAQISEAKEIKDTEIEDSLVESNKADAELADSLMEEVIDLKAKNAELLKTGLVKESMEDMTAVQKDKFLKLATIVEFDAKNPTDFITKMDTLAESVKSDVKEVKAKKEVNEEVINESTNDTYVSKARHLY